MTGLIGFAEGVSETLIENLLESLRDTDPCDPTNQDIWNGVLKSGFNGAGNKYLDFFGDKLQTRLRYMNKRNGTNVMNYDRWSKNYNTLIIARTVKASQ